MTEACYRLFTWVAAAWFNPLAGRQPCLAHAAAAAQSRQLCQPLCNPRYCSLPGSPAHGIFSARILEQAWGLSSSRGPSWPRNRTRISCVSCIIGGSFTRATREASLEHETSFILKNSGITDLWYCISFGCITKWFCIYTHCEMITISIVNIYHHI